MSPSTAPDTSKQSATISELSALLVTWKNPATGRYYLMGTLRLTHKAYSFRYFRRVKQDQNFRPIIGFSDLAKHYESSVLFPMFSSRLMSARRTDRPKWLTSLGLDESASEALILSRSLGRRVADNYELLAEPEIDPLRSCVTALTPIHGLELHEEGRLYVRAGNLRQGDEVTIRRVPNNPAHPRPLLVSTSSNILLSHIPRPLLDYVEDLNLPTDQVTASVTFVNPKRPDIHQQIQLRATWHP